MLGDKYASECKQASTMEKVDEAINHPSSYFAFAHNGTISHIHDAKKKITLVHGDDNEKPTLLITEQNCLLELNSHIFFPSVIPFPRKANALIHPGCFRVKSPSKRTQETSVVGS